MKKQKAVLFMKHRVNSEWWTLVWLWAPVGGFGPLAASFGNLSWGNALD